MEYCPGEAILSGWGGRWEQGLQNSGLQEQAAWPSERQLRNAGPAWGEKTEAARGRLAPRLSFKRAGGSCSQEVPPPPAAAAPPPLRAWTPSEIPPRARRAQPRQQMGLFRATLHWASYFPQPPSPCLRSAGLCSGRAPLASCQMSPPHLLPSLLPTHPAHTGEVSCSHLWGGRMCGQRSPVRGCKAGFRAGF